MKKLLFLVAFGCFVSLRSFGQSHVSFRDSLDKKLDLSDWVLSANGFIPVPYLITEPALGGIGGALFPVFVEVNTPYLDSINGELVKTRVKPNLYGVGAAYTANDSWLGAGAAMGVIKRWRLNYRIATGFADINLEFYKEFKNDSERSFEFNIQTFPVYAQLIKQFKRSSWYVGFNYLYLKTELKSTNSDFHSENEIKSNVSKLGVLLEYDNRDNVFTPDKGFRWNTLFAASNEVFGSDYDYSSINSAAFFYVPVSKKLISGFRLEYQQVWGDVPFYLLPYLNLRGIPVARYQGDLTTLAETEWRWDFAKRMSVVSFWGAGKALLDGTSFQDANWRFSGGLGGRYLIARKLKLRMGLDVARGPEQWAYYIVFGTTWVR